MRIPHLLENQFNKMIDKIGDIIGSRFVYEMNIGYRFRTEVHVRVLKRYFRHIPYTVFTDMDDNKLEYELPRMGEHYDWFIYRNTPICIRIVAVVGNDNGQRYIDQEVFLATFRERKHINHLHDFWKMLRKQSRKMWESGTIRQMEVVMDSHGGRPDYMDLPYRSFDDVFIPDETRLKITNYLDHFIKSKDWYHDHMIPYHAGIILHGDPGTGKSSVIQAIINRYDCEVYYISTNCVKRVFVEDGGYSPLRRFHGITKPLFIIIEDIDTSIVSASRNTDDDKKTDSKEILGTILNFMDGLTAPSNVVYIFTTNHIDQLDPALIRPGRIDISVHIDYVTDETLDKFLMFHYKQHLPADKHVKEHTTFASIQILVMCGKSFDEFISEVCK